MLKLKQFVSSQFCLTCKGCCRFSQENSVWAPHLLNTEKEKLDKKIRLINYPKEDNFICASFDVRNNKCKLYALRPFECRIYPFLINCEEEKIFLAIHLKCPYVQEKIKSKDFQAHICYLTELFNSPGIRRILKDNPQIIHRYSEVLNLRELKIL